MTRFFLPALVSALLSALLCACAMPKTPTAEQLAANGVKNGADASDVQGKLTQDGFQCKVSGEKNEDFTCRKDATSNLGLSRCEVRVDFRAAEGNKVADLIVPQAPCGSF